MPCYDGCREDARIDREVAKKVEAVLCGLISAFGFGKVLERLEFVEVGVTREWLVSWWREHLQKDTARLEAEKARKEVARKEAIIASGDFQRLGKVIHKPRTSCPACWHYRKLSRLVARHSLRRHPRRLQGYGLPTPVMCA